MWGLVLRRPVQVGSSGAAHIDLGQEMGELQVAGHPWAWVQLGQRPASETPAHFNLPAGNYALTFECPDGKRRSQQVEVVEGRQANLSVDCAAAAGP